jgi:hypothetical protein
MTPIKMRRDLVLMGTFAAIAGIGLAAALTAALGVRSSGPPAPLKVASVPPATTAAKTTVVAPKHTVAHKAAPHRKRHTQRRHRAHRRRAPRVAPAPAPTRVVAQAPAPTQVQQAPVQRQTQPVSRPVTPVSKPAPAPRPSRPVSTPKPKHTPGVAFDDSG